MIFKETKLKGAYIIELEPMADERGFFARSYCQEEFEAHGLNTRIVQCNVSYNKKKGTLRGMHYQTAPYEEVKLINCPRGVIYDVIIDLRPYSPTYSQWFAVELSSENNNMIYIPKGLVHGFQTLEDDTVVNYQMSEFYHAECARGLRWNDPAFVIEWPLPNPILSDKDQSYLDFGKGKE